MMVGHGLLAFAFVASVAAVGGWSRERALAAGAVAGGFAVVPDADMVYALAGVLQADLSGVFSVTNAFWTASTLVHRSATHSVVIAVPAALAFALWTTDRRWARALAVAVLAAITALGTVVSGTLGGVVFLAFALAGLALAEVARRLTDLAPPTVLALALFGLVTHPFGDVFTGEPPQLFYPLAATPFDGRVALNPDPTLHLLGTFGLEVIAVWLAAAVVLWQTDLCETAAGERRWPAAPRLQLPVAPHAALGVGYAAAAFVLPAPTLSVSYHFVFSILGVGALLGVFTLRGRPAPWRRLSERLAAPDPEAALSVVLTGTAAVTVALVAYATVYVGLIS